MQGTIGGGGGELGLLWPFDECVWIQMRECSAGLSVFTEIPAPNPGARERERARGRRNTE